MKGKRTIGKLAREAGVNVETVRYYQRINLIDEPRGGLSGYRHYPREVVARIRFIKRAQQLGFTLSEIGELLELDDGCCTDVRHVAESKRDRVQSQIDDLLAIREALDELIVACKGTEFTPKCAMIEALTDLPESV